MLDPSCDLLIKFIEAAPERGVGWGKLWQYGSESGAENAAVGSGAEPQDSQAGVGNAIAGVRGMRSMMPCKRLSLANRSIEPIFTRRKVDVS